MKTQHTPGPWTVTECCDSTFSVTAAQLQWPDRPDIRDTVAICPSPRVRADALLIAAAPDLLAAAQSALSALEALPPLLSSRGDRNESTQAELRAAIALVQPNTKPNHNNNNK